MKKRLSIFNQYEKFDKDYGFNKIKKSFSKNLNSIINNYILKKNIFNY